MIKNNIIKVKSYYNANKLKDIILKENKNKCGIYRWNNIVTGKSYIGSAKCLRTRFFKYYSIISLNYSLKRGTSAIYSALLKHGYEKFKLRYS
jgi:excinuclease UvrABC nuclease subunit